MMWQKMGLCQYTLSSRMQTCKAPLGCHALCLLVMQQLQLQYGPVRAAKVEHAV